MTKLKEPVKAAPLKAEPEPEEDDENEEENPDEDEEELELGRIANAIEEDGKTTEHVTRDATQPAPPATPTPNGAPASTPSATAKAPPTAQQVSLGEPFLSLDLRTSNFTCMRQTGTPVTKKVKEKVREPVHDAKTGKETYVEKEVTRTIVEYNWGPDEQQGDAFPSLTTALRRQADLAKAHQAEGYVVKEDTKKEYGVWYATHTDPAKPGFRYHLGYVVVPMGQGARAVGGGGPKTPRAKKEKTAKVATTSGATTTAGKQPKGRAPQAKPVNDPASVAVRESDTKAQAVVDEDE